MKSNFLWLIIGIALIIFFFFNAGEFLLKNYNRNWAYVFDQLALSAIGFFLALIWLKAKHAFKLNLLVVLLITTLVLITHYEFINRVVTREPLQNYGLFLKLKKGESINYTYSDSILFRQRGRYGLAPLVATLQLSDVFSSHSIALGAFSLTLFILASLAGAWLAGTLSGSQVVSLIVGLLIGISPNTYASLPWFVNLSGDYLGITLISLMLGVWVVARKTKDIKGILLSLLLLAGVLKGGGCTRTVIAGLLLIITDIILLKEKISKKNLIIWSSVFAVEGIFYLLNLRLQMSAVSGYAESFGLNAPLVVRVAQFFEIAAKSFMPPTLLSGLMTKLIKLDQTYQLFPPGTNYLWIVLIGAIVFLVGTSIALLSLASKKLKMFAWAWVWFWLTVFYVPWFSEEFSSNLGSIDSRSVITELYPGFRYGVLPLLGIHVAVGWFLGSLITNYRATSKKILKILNWQKIAILIAVVLIVFRSYEFMRFDRRWSIEVNNPARAWQNTLFSILPTDSTDPKSPSIVVNVDGDHNPFSIAFNLKFLYPDNSVIFFESVEDFWNNYVLKGKVIPEKVFALGWDSGKQEEVDLTPTFRKWLTNSDSASWKETDFKGWSQGENFFEPKIDQIGMVKLIKEPLVVSPELNIPLPNPREMVLDLKVDLKDAAREDTLSESTISEAKFINSLSGKSLVSKSDWDSVDWSNYTNRLSDINQRARNGGVDKALMPSKDDGSFTIALLCDSSIGKKNTQDLLWKQQFDSDWLERSKKKIPLLQRYGEVDLVSNLQCEGSTLKRLVILGPSMLSFKIVEIKISFMYPDIESRK